VADVIPLHRVKIVDTAALAARFEGTARDRAPDKARELRTERRPSRFAGRELDVLATSLPLKLPPRARRHAKLRLFRVFKLFDALKAEAAAPSYRPIADRLRLQRWMRRL
jgi:hypothetical protein